MLLFRFALISVGFILAVLASGMPLTQITVLMGALGVGIGFGLQNIFNNMISGLIIAIEKPISVGDMIEVGSNIGWVKGIGIRSSNIQAFDGAEVIIPNGELISNKVTNWTLSDKTRRMDIQVGVAYKSDPHQVYDVLIKVVAAHPEVLKNPEPFIIFTGLGESSLDFKIYFWISDFVEGMRIRSEVLFQVFDALHQNNIEIPFPQRDLHLKSVEPELMKQNSVALKNKQE
jgi:small-conductance mechanosensitive channel